MSSASAWQDWHGTGLVVGCGGIGQALLQELASIAPGLQLVGASRQDWRLPKDPLWRDVEFLALDLTDDSSLSALAASLENRPPLRLVINTAGLYMGPCSNRKSGSAR